MGVFLPLAATNLEQQAPRRAARQIFLPFAPPLIGEEEIAEVAATLRSGWLTTGPKTSEFERDFAEALGAQAALALNSCTAALHLALLTLDIGEGDEVVTTPLTFAATANVVEHVRARVVLVDVEPDTLNIDPARVEAALTPRTRAILPVHYAGHPADLDALELLARPRGIAVVEDAAHALPAAYRGRPIGSGENLTAFSFYATKNLTTGEGGMLTGPPELLARARTLALHGMSHDGWARYRQGGGWRYAVESPGYKYNMSDIQASLGVVQLRRLEAAQQRRREIVAAYTAALADLDAIELPAERADVVHAWHLFPIRLRRGALRIGRDRFIQELAELRIGASVHFIPVHLHPYYRERYGWRPNDFPVAAAAFQRLVSLPLSPALSDDDAADVIDAVETLVRRWRR
jgi:dTDP-4-amino-4,6-dideoxygalactose transaminase